jgi:hypothetical protein
MKVEIYNSEGMVQTQFELIADENEEHVFSGTYVEMYDEDGMRLERINWDEPLPKWIDEDEIMDMLANEMERG